MREVGKRKKADFLRDVVIYKVILFKCFAMIYLTVCQQKSPVYMRATLACAMKKRYLLPPNERKTSTSGSMESLTPLVRIPSLEYDEENFSWKEFVVPTGDGANCIRTTGKPLQDVFDTLEQKIKSDDGIIAPVELPVDLFDKLEFIVFSLLKEAHLESFKASPYYTEYINFMMLCTKPLTIDDFTLFRVLGRGGFGVVNGCKHSHTGKLYAMKVMDRKRIKAMRAETLLLAERATMMMLDSPFIVGLKYAFTTPTDLYLILDLMLGGDLGYLLYRRGPFNALEVKYYAARTLLGLKALHDLGIVFRGMYICIYILVCSVIGL